MSRKVWKLNSVIAGLSLAAILLTFSGGFATVNGVYHKARRGETVWRISRAYGVSIEQITKANNLPSSAKIRAGQYLFIPGAEKVIGVEPLDSQIRFIFHYGTSRRWKYIVIHHSSTEKGNARVFDRNHRTKRHFQHGLGYHFVICNGSYGRKDGQIEVGKRWWHQLDGAHCKAGDGNNVGIGICLVGDFEKTAATGKQFTSLVHLVTNLCYNYNIAVENIKGHNEMPGAATDCPGKNFPWDELRKALYDRGCR